MAAAYTQRAQATGQNWLNWVAGLITVGGLACMTSVILITFQSQTRIFLAMARDGLLPRGLFCFIHPTFRTPVVAIAIHVIFAAILAVAGSFAQLALLSTVARLTTYLAGCASLPFLGKRTARTMVLAVLGTLVALIFVITLHPVNLVAAGIALVVGAAIYFVAGGMAEGHGEVSGAVG